MRLLKILSVEFLSIAVLVLSSANIQARRAEIGEQNDAMRSGGSPLKNYRLFTTDRSASWMMNYDSGSELSDDGSDVKNEGASAGKRDGAGHEATTKRSEESLPSRDGQINRAYLDAVGILSEDNKCSRFFGGSRVALTVLASLAGRLHKTTLDSGVGILMYGPVTDVVESKGGFRYRIFEKAVVNLAGPFSAHQTVLADPHVHNVGSFPPASREARVLMLLHELGHLIPGPDGKWLLPDDGGDSEQSDRNTRFVETKCGEQIRSLRNW
jgi:hypothetical protein